MFKNIPTKLFSIVAVIFLFSQNTFAATTDGTENIKKLGDSIVNNIASTAVTLLMTAGFIVFFYGLVIFLVNRARGENTPEKIALARSFMIWGLVGLFVMVSTWGIIRFFQDTLGIDGGNINIQAVSFSSSKDSSTKETASTTKSTTKPATKNTNNTGACKLTDNANITAYNSNFGYLSTDSYRDNLLANNKALCTTFDNFKQQIKNDSDYLIFAQGKDEATAQNVGTAMARDYYKQAGYDESKMDTASSSVYNIGGWIYISIVNNASTKQEKVDMTDYDISLSLSSQETGKNLSPVDGLSQSPIYEVSTDIATGTLKIDISIDTSGVNASCNIQMKEAEGDDYSDFSTQKIFVADISSDTTYFKVDCGDGTNTKKVEKFFSIKDTSNTDVASTCTIDSSNSNIDTSSSDFNYLIDRENIYKTLLDKYSNMCDSYNKFKNEIKDNTYYLALVQNRDTDVTVAAASSSALAEDHFTKILNDSTPSTQPVDSDYQSLDSSDGGGYLYIGLFQDQSDTANN